MIPAPISLGAGIILGTKAYRDEADQRLKRRRAEAKVLVKKYSDDVVFYVSKQLKDRMRIVQRAVRDHYSDVAEELSTSLKESVANAQKAASANAAERAARLAEVKKTLGQLDEVTRSAMQLVAQTSAPDRPGRPAGARRPSSAHDNGSGMPGNAASQAAPGGRDQAAGAPAGPMRTSA